MTWTEEWESLEEIMDSENGEESMVVVQAYAARLARQKTRQDFLPRLASHILVWRRQTLRSDSGIPLRLYTKSVYEERLHKLREFNANNTDLLPF